MSDRAKPEHRHFFVVVRDEPNTGRPLVKKCSCGEHRRYHRGRWVPSGPKPC